MDNTSIGYGLLMLYIIGTIWFGLHVKGYGTEGDITDDSEPDAPIKDKLTSEQFRLAIILLIMNPVIGGAILYTILNKKMPGKAKQVNHISMIIFLVEVILGLGLGYAYVSYFKAPVTVSEDTQKKRVEDSEKKTDSDSLEKSSENQSNTEADTSKKEIMDVISYVMDEILPVFDEGDTFYFAGLDAFDNKNYDEASVQFQLAKEKYSEGLALHDAYEYPAAFGEFDTMLHDGITMANDAMDLLTKSIEIKNLKALDEAMKLDSDSSDMVQDAYAILDTYAEQLSASDAYLYSLMGK